MSRLFWSQISWKKFVFFRICKSRFIPSFLFRIILSLLGMLRVALCLGIFVLFYTQFFMDLHNLQISGPFFLAVVSLNLFLRSSDSDSYIFQTRPLRLKNKREKSFLTVRKNTSRKYTKTVSGAGRLLIRRSFLIWWKLMPVYLSGWTHGTSEKSPNDICMNRQK